MKESSVYSIGSHSVYFDILSACSVLLMSLKPDYRVILLRSKEYKDMQILVPSDVYNVRKTSSIITGSIVHFSLVQSCL